MTGTAVTAVPTLRLAIIGMGRMGHALADLAGERGFHVVATIDSAHTAAGSGISRATLADADVAVEFTEPASAVGNIRACLAAGCPVVVGTTGWYDALPTLDREVRDRKGALLWASNFSVGVHLFAEMVEHAARALRGQDAFDAHVVETHHAAKKDAPSGTAGLLARRAADALGRDVPITSVRTGSVPGTHELIFDAPFEQIRLLHVARDRRVFADGALRAARWLAVSGRRGVFQMRDVLGTPETP